MRIVNFLLQFVIGILRAIFFKDIFARFHYLQVNIVSNLQRILLQIFKECYLILLSSPFSFLGFSLQFSLSIFYLIICQIVPLFYRILVLQGLLTGLFFRIKSNGNLGSERLRLLVVLSLRGVRT